MQKLSYLNNPLTLCDVMIICYELHANPHLLLPSI